jgi:hypothetical protein
MQGGKIPSVYFILKSEILSPFYGKFTIMKGSHTQVESYNIQKISDLAKDFRVKWIYFSDKYQTSDKY